MLDGPHRSKLVFTLNNDSTTWQPRVRSEWIKPTEDTVSSRTTLGNSTTTHSTSSTVQVRPRILIRILDGKHHADLALDEEGHFDGGKGYGYISLEKFVDAARQVTAGNRSAADYEGKGLPTAQATVLTTAIIHAGRKSLDEKRSVELKEENGAWKLV